MGANEVRPRSGQTRARWLNRWAIGTWLLCSVSLGWWVWGHRTGRLDLIPLGWGVDSNGSAVLRLRLTNGTAHARFVVDGDDGRLFVTAHTATGYWSGARALANSLQLAIAAGGHLDTELPAASLPPPVKAECVVRERIPENWLRLVSIIPSPSMRQTALNGLNRWYPPQRLTTGWIAGPTNR